MTETSERKQRMRIAKRIAAVVLALSLTACGGGWNYEFHPDTEDGEPGVDSKCGIVELEKHGIWTTKTYGQGRFCLEEGG